MSSTSTLTGELYDYLTPALDRAVCLLFPGQNSGMTSSRLTTSCRAGHGDHEGETTGCFQGCVSHALLKGRDVVLF